MGDRTPSSARRTLLAATLLVVAVVLLQILPDLGRGDFFREEGRRVIPAREMLESGDWIVPTIWSTPYLAKPPATYWILALSFRAFGGVTEYAARFPSLLATLGTALSLLWFGRRIFGLRAGLCAAILFPLSVEVLKKGRLAEIESLLALFVFLSVGTWWLGRRGAIGWSFLSGLCLGASLLLKGPAALVFFLGPPLCLAVGERSLRGLVSSRLLLPLGLGVVLAGAWVLLVIRQVGYDEAVDLWVGETLNRGTWSVTQYLRERGRFVFGTAAAFFPASFLIVLAWRTPAWRRLRGAPNTAFALWAAASGWIFFALFPGTQVRYGFPTLPFAALLAGYLLESGLAVEPARIFAARLEVAARILAVLGLALLVVAPVGFFVPLGDVRVSDWGLVLALAVGVLSVSILRPSGHRWRILAGFVVLPLLIGQVLTSQVGAATARRHQRAHLGHELDATVPPGVPLHVAFWMNFCTLAYVEHEVRFSPHFRDLPPRSWVLLTTEQFEGLPEKPHGGIAFDEVYRREFWGGARVLVRSRGEP